MKPFDPFLFEGKSPSLDPEWIFEQLFSLREDLKVIAEKFYEGQSSHDSKDDFLRFLIDVYSAGIDVGVCDGDFVDYPQYQDNRVRLHNAI